ncbi:DUF4360 domain-containing protein [Lyngbya confervoides]|uniref:DUF4360 domain-containing protein n=1 Tax=Lyngbya confervoides BDU141951 TaxID=1574623 RepID=A0ABD4T099_9CYAN|nr:DUF4360 domain-containing protein [Lyngbya confervoides]MCM1982059.1 DUF4360 domain-containing protein [Lyngbya confervoides BDU141951]
MKLLPILFASVTALTAFVNPALGSSNRVEIRGANYGGSGCPDQSASVSVSPDGQELSILFDEFIALGNDYQESRKSCNLSIPIQVPQGFQISLYDADYRGYVSPNTSGRLRAEYFFAGQRGPVFTRVFRGETDYSVRDPLVTVADVWSACGDSVNMRVNASMMARGPGIATVDSFDLAHRGLVYHIKYRRCR